MRHAHIDNLPQCIFGELVSRAADMKAGMEAYDDLYHDARKIGDLFSGVKPQRLTLRWACRETGTALADWSKPQDRAWLGATFNTRFRWVRYVEVEVAAVSDPAWGKNWYTVSFRDLPLPERCHKSKKASPEFANV